MTWKVSYKTASYSPGQAAQLVKTLSLYIKTEGVIPGQDTYKNQRANECISKGNNKLMFYSLFLSFPVFLESIDENFGGKSIKIFFSYKTVLRI